MTNATKATPATAATRPGIAEAMASIAAIAGIPDKRWTLGGDDLCDCALQQIWEVTNPHIAETLQVRLCCLVAAVEREFPQFAPFIRHIPAWLDVNRNRFNPEPLAWDNREADMPVPLWYRQMAHKTGRPLADIRAEYRTRKGERPKRIGDRRSAYVQPTQAEMTEAQRQRAVATGWLIEAEEDQS